MGEGEGDKILAFHPEAVQIREDLRHVFDSFGEITFCAALEKFSKSTENTKYEIGFESLYQYVTKTTPPAWLMPHLLKFLTQVPYINYMNVWEFIRKYGGPIQESLERIKAKAFAAKAETLAQAGQYDEFL